MSLWQLTLCCAVSFLLHLLIGVVRGLQRQPDEVLEQQDRQFLDVSQLSTFLLSDRPGFITNSLQLNKIRCISEINFWLIFEVISSYLKL